jgi:hypothetical protein
MLLEELTLEEALQILKTDKQKHMTKYKVYVNGVVDFETSDHTKFDDTVGHYIDQFYEAGFLMVLRDGVLRDGDVYDMHYVFYNYDTRATGSVGYKIEYVCQ